MRVSNSSSANMCAGWNRSSCATRGRGPESAYRRGTDALQLALMALRVGVGDEVITSPFTFFATWRNDRARRARAGFLRYRLRYVQFVAGCGPGFHRSPLHRGRAAGCANRVTGGRVVALMPVHLYGQSADMVR